MTLPAVDRKQRRISLGTLTEREVADLLEAYSAVPGGQGDEEIREFMLPHLRKALTKVQQANRKAGLSREDIGR